jgi:DeoR family fructose operon transcriptional repressor
MNQKERQKSILAYLRQNKTATYDEIESMFDVSNMTIRRDIVCLADAGKVIKTIGGAQIAGVSADIYESEILSRLSVHSTEKRAISEYAMAYIKTNDVIFIDGSSTCLELAKRINEADVVVTVVTNSLLVHMELARSKTITVVCLGGQHDSITYCLTGPQTESQAEKYFINKAFFSTKGFSPKEGTFESSIAAYRVKQIISQQSSEVILLVDHSKFGQKSLCKVLDISEIDTVFTDNLISSSDKAILEKVVKKVILCEQNSPKAATA